MIGDPSGKSQERNLLSREQIDANVAGIRQQLAKFLDFDAPGNAARIVNNADWLGTIDVLSFLRDTGKHFTVNYMLQKESVNRRLESEEGISFTEFSYLVLQAYDFLQLFDRYSCVLQMGGSDQWGNITAGIELDSQAAREEGARPGLAADEDGVGREVRQDRGRHGLAGSRAHVAVPLLSVLAEHRRSRRRDVSEVLHVSRPAGDRRARDGGRASIRSSARRSACWRAKSPRSCTATIRSRAPSTRRACCSARTSRRFRSTTCWRCSRTCRRPSCRSAELGADGMAIVDLRGARAARAVEERGAAAGAVGRRLREQPARRPIRRRG